MKNKIQYKTKHHEQLISYLKAANGRHLTASEIYENFRSQGITIGVATIYRQLEKLVSEGTVRKFIIDSSSPACFEYAGDSQFECKSGSCFHLKCEKCGKLIHLECEELSTISTHLLSEHNFTLNSMKTVFYGCCEECMKEERMKKEAQLL